MLNRREQEIKHQNKGLKDEKNSAGHRALGSWQVYAQLNYMKKITDS